jgi:casein kinase 1
MDGQIILNKYFIEKKIGNGQFGTVYKGKNIKSGEQIAIKTEFKKTQYKILKHETTILNHLYNSGCRCSPIVYWYGIYCEYTCLVMPFYSCPLDIYITNNSISFIQLYKIMSKLIQILENIHQYYVIHRDIKPQNFMLNYSNMDDNTSEKELFLIDFGLSTIYVDEMNKHVNINEDKKEYIVGNPKFMSYNIYDGIEPSRRDDLISLGYIYLYIILGILPWDINNNTILSDTQNDITELHVCHVKNQYRKNKKKWEYLSDYIFSIIKEKIDNIEYTNALNKIHKYLDYCYNMGFSTNPNYDGLIALFTNTI